MTNFKKGEIDIDRVKKIEEKRKKRRPNMTDVQRLMFLEDTLMYLQGSKGTLKGHERGVLKKHVKGINKIVQKLKDRGADNASQRLDGVSASLASMIKAFSTIPKPNPENYFGD